MKIIVIKVMNLNKVFEAGRLTRDPETTTLPNSNTTVTNLGFVTNRVFKNKNDEKVEEATFIDVKAWGKTGETIAKYLKKGSPIFIEGRITQETWDTKEGDKRSKLVITLENYKFINDGSRKEEEPKDDLGF